LKYFIAVKKSAFYCSVEKAYCKDSVAKFLLDMGLEKMKRKKMRKE